MNDGIAPVLCSLSYPSIDTAIDQVLGVGRGAQPSKLDIKDTYRIVPVHPEDWPLLGMYWKGQYFVDTRLPFGLRSAPKLFTALANAVQWLIKEKEVDFCIHYLDDYLFIKPPGAHAHALAAATQTLAELSIPMAPDKVEGPVTRVTFLGIELDSQTLTARLPTDKLQRLTSMIAEWKDQKVCTKRELLLLIGALQHATMVVRSG